MTTKSRLSSRTTARDHDNESSLTDDSDDDIVTDDMFVTDDSDDDNKITSVIKDDGPEPESRLTRAASPTHAGSGSQRPAAPAATGRAGGGGLHRRRRNRTGQTAIGADRAETRKRGRTKPPPEGAGRRPAGVHMYCLGVLYACLRSPPISLSTFLSLCASV